MTKGTASNSYASPQLQDAISRLEKMHVEAREEVRQQEYRSSKGEPEKALREAQHHAQRTGQALSWARGQGRRMPRFLLSLLLRNFLILFPLAFGLKLWDTYTSPLTGTPDFWILAFDAALDTLVFSTTFGLLEWWRGRRAYKELVEPGLSKKE
jgi:hypothetical protein